MTINTSEILKKLYRHKYNNEYTDDIAAKYILRFLNNIVLEFCY